MDNQWHLVYTKAKQEEKAEQHLKNQGFEVYLPRHCVSARKKGKYTDIIQPLFPRYLFVQLTEGVHNYAPIRSTRGAVGLVRVGVDPAIAPRDLIEYLQSNEAVALEPRPANPFHAGDRVQVVDGPFAGYEAIYQCEQGEERALILLSLMNQFSKVTLPVHDLAKAI